MEHKSKLDNYPGTMEELATEIGDLRYDALANFLELLASKIEQDGRQDEARGRVQLATRLFACAEKLSASKSYIDLAWRISAPRM